MTQNAEPLYYPTHQQLTRYQDFLADSFARKGIKFHFQITGHYYLCFDSGLDVTEVARTLSDSHSETTSREEYEPVSEAAYQGSLQIDSVVRSAAFQNTAPCKLARRLICQFWKSSRARWRSLIPAATLAQAKCFCDRAAPLWPASRLGVPFFAAGPRYIVPIRSGA